MKLEAKDISFRYLDGGRQVLNKVSLTVEAGERVGLMAPSGFGKTTLCKILSGYEKADSGQVLLDGKPLSEFTGYCPVQMIWQHPELSVNPRRRLKTVLAEGDWMEKAGAEKGGAEKGRAEKDGTESVSRDNAFRIEKGLGIEEEWKERFPVEVSGGELQRFCIARALGNRTKILLADEITTMLDLITQGQIWGFLLEEIQRRKISLVAVSHSEELLEKVCDRIVRLG